VFGIRLKWSKVKTLKVVRNVAGTAGLVCRRLCIYRIAERSLAVHQDQHHLSDPKRGRPSRGAIPPSTVPKQLTKRMKSLPAVFVASTATTRWSENCYGVFPTLVTHSDDWKPVQALALRPFGAISYVNGKGRDLGRAAASAATRCSHSNVSAKDFSLG